MKSRLLEKSDKLLLSIKDISRLLSVGEESAKVSAVRYVKADILSRLKKDTYILTSKLKALTEEELFSIANLVQVPSYISLTSALSYFNISTQIMRGVVESIAVKRTKRVEVNNYEFVFSLVKKNFYTGFERKEGIFIASPEKALADAVYLSSIGKYNADYYAIDFKKTNLSQVDRFIDLTNLKTQRYWEELCKTFNL